MLSTLLLAALLASSHEHSSGPENPTTHVNGQTYSDQRGSQDAPLIVHEDRRPQSKQEAAEDHQSRVEEEHRQTIGTGLNLGLVVVGLLQVFGIIGQIILYRRQTHIMDGNLAATQRAATSAEKSVKAVVGDERAWVLITVTAQHDNAYDWHIKNHGRTPARIASLRFDPTIHNAADTLQQRSDYSATRVGYSRVLAPGEDFAFFTLNVARMFQPSWTGIERGEYIVYFPIEVTYSDVLDETVIHKTAEVYVYRLSRSWELHDLPGFNEPEHHRGVQGVTT